MSDWKTCGNRIECIEGNQFGKGCIVDMLQNAMGGKPWHECHCGVDDEGNPPNKLQAEKIDRLTVVLAEAETRGWEKAVKMAAEIISKGDDGYDWSPEGAAAAILAMQRG